MKPVLRALAFSWLVLTPLVAACESPAPAAVVAPPATAAPAPPPVAELSICQRDAKPTSGGDTPIIASFEAFSRTWIDKMRAIAAARGVAGRKRLRNTYEMQLVPTGSEQAPYVGVLHYCEVALTCASAEEASCTAVSSVVVTEMFRYQAGQWVY